MKAFRMLQDKPLHTRRRIAIIVTGSIAVILVLILIIIYSHPTAPKHDPERGIAAAYTTFLDKIQSLFHRK